MLSLPILIIFSFIRIIPQFLIISFTSFIIVKSLKIFDFIDKILIIFLLNCAQIIISVEILSLFRAVTALNLIIFYISTCAIGLLLAFLKKINIKIDFRKFKYIVSNFYKNLELNKILKILIFIWIAIISE